MRRSTTEQAPDETLEHYYRRLAKVADQRLLRLERLEQSGQEGFTNVTKWAYQNAMKDIQHFDGENAKRFNTAPPATELQLESKIRAIKRFLEAPTSTKSAILKSYNAKAKTFNKKYGTNFTWQDIGKAYESASMEKLNEKGFGSDTIARALAVIKNNIKPEDLTEKVKQIDLTDTDLATRKVIEEILNDESISIDELMGDY